jgi:hypothetical protein
VGEGDVSQQKVTLPGGSSKGPEIFNVGEEDSMFSLVIVTWRLGMDCQVKPGNAHDTVIRRQVRRRSSRQPSSGSLELTSLLLR